jgi:hypothetical protein
MTKPQKLIVGIVVAAGLIAATWFLLGDHRTAPGQPPLAELTPGSLDELRAEFNAAADRPRVILLLSPT